MGVLLFVVFIVGISMISKAIARKAAENQQELNSLRGEHEKQEDLGNTIAQRTAMGMKK